MTKAAGKKMHTLIHLLFVCEEKAKVSLAKSSVFSYLASFDLTQKLSSERSSGPNWVEEQTQCTVGTKDVNGNNVKKKKCLPNWYLATLIQQIFSCIDPCNTSKKKNMQRQKNNCKKSRCGVPREPLLWARLYYDLFSILNLLLGYLLNLWNLGSWWKLRLTDKLIYAHCQPQERVY